MVEIKGKVVIITGSASGLGLETLKRLLVDAKVVVAVDRNITNLKSLSSPNLDAYQLDITNWKGIDQLYDYVIIKYGRVDIVFNNAGIFEPPGANYWADEDVESYAVIDINVSALFKSTRVAIKKMLAQPKPERGPVGVIVNTSSVAGHSFLFSAPVYVASKWAVSGFTRSLGILHTRLGIRVLALAPGSFETPLWSEEKLSWMTNSAWATLEEVTDAMMRCATDESLVGGSILEVTPGATTVVPFQRRVRDEIGATANDSGFQGSIERVIAHLQGEKVQF